MHMIGMDLASGKDRLALSIVDGAGKVLAIIDRDDLNTKNARRKKERRFIAEAVKAIVSRHSAEVQEDEDRDCITLRFSLNGVGAMIHIDGLHGGAWSLIHWHNTGWPVRDFSKRFTVAIGDLLKSWAHHKATSHPGDWYSLAMRLDAGLCLAFANQAFEAAHDL